MIVKTRNSPVLISSARVGLTPVKMKSIMSGTIIRFSIKTSMCRSGRDYIHEQDYRRSFALQYIHPTIKNVCQRNHVPAGNEQSRLAQKKNLIDCTSRL